MQDDPAQQVLPVILSGGSGTRLWPLSTKEAPKQFHRLATAGTLLQDTARRFVSDNPVRFLPPVIICNRAHGSVVELQLAEVGLQASLIVLEPLGRNTAAAAVVAAEAARRLHPGVAVLLVPADHVIADAAGFRAVVARGLAAARNRIVTFGLRPTSPETGFGYIQQGEAIGEGVFSVLRFAEKPDRSTAERYIAEGEYSWNAGMFLFSPDVLIAEMRALRPNIAAAATQSLDRAVRNGLQMALDEAAFADCPSESIDYAVMEKTRHAAVAPCDIGWADVGSWSELWRLSGKDDRGNVLAGDALAIDSQDCLIRVEDCTVVTIGVEDLIVVAAGGRVLVTRKGRAQDVKLAVEALAVRDRTRRVVASPPAVSLDDPADALADLAGRLHDWLFRRALPLWAAAGVAPEGGFHELLSPTSGSPVPADRRFRVQARQTYVYALAGRLGWPGPWREVVEHGLEIIETRYRQADGLVRGAVRPDGEPVSDAVTLYDQAFALFAQAAVTAAGVRDLAQSALAHLERVRAHFGGGWTLRENGGPSPYQSNPMMHLFEAALAWSTVSQGPAWPALADEVAELSLTRFIDPQDGFLREYFDEHSAPAPGEPGRLVEPGHQFEWAWLLTRWGVERGSERALTAARKMFGFAEKYGVDHRRGVVLDAIAGDGWVLRGGARLWPQTERLKAALILAHHAGDEDGRARYRRTAISAATTLLRYLDTPTPGLWRDKLTVEDAFIDEPAPASSLYHIACAIAEMQAYGRPDAASAQPSPK